MFDFITKADIFRWADDKVRMPTRGNIKDFQDAFALSLMQGQSGMAVLEMGGGDSRVLRELAPKNECWNVDIFQGKDGGPAYVPEIPGVKTVMGLMGQFLPDVPSNHFDYVFSVSVVEHIPAANLKAVFEDCMRVLKPNGIMAHAIDMYLLDESERGHPHFKQNEVRLEAYQQAINHCIANAGATLVGPSVVGSSPVFRSSMVTNPDHTMITWNKVAPTLRPLREISQAVSLKLVMRKDG